MKIQIVDRNSAQPLSGCYREYRLIPGGIEPVRDLERFSHWISVGPSTDFVEVHSFEGHWSGFNQEIGRLRKLAEEDRQIFMGKIPTSVEQSSLPNWQRALGKSPNQPHFEFDYDMQHVKIGIIDNFCVMIDEISHMTALNFSNSPKSLNDLGQHTHGHNTAMIIGGRNDLGFEGFCRDAQIFCADVTVSSSRHARFDNIVEWIENMSDPSEGIEADLIVVPWDWNGSLDDEDLEALKAAVEEAYSFGTLCVFPAGNGFLRKNLSQALTAHRAVGVSGAILDQITQGCPNSLLSYGVHNSRKNKFCYIHKRNINGMKRKYEVDPFTYCGDERILRAESSNIFLAYNNQAKYDLYGSSWAAAISASSLGLILAQYLHANPIANRQSRRNHLESHLWQHPNYRVMCLPHFQLGMLDAH